MHSFGTGTDGTVPVAGVTLDTSGNLYGTTSAGGAYGYGTVFQLKRSASSWTENILHDFALGSDGGIPYAGLVLDNKGALYGAATEGGGGASSGGGTVFELTHAGSNWTFTVIYDLPGWDISGTFRNVLLESGKIYATTHCDGDYNAGTVYELTSTNGKWTYDSLYVFTGGTDGLYSFSNLVPDKAGNLYGTTDEAGSKARSCLQSYAVALSACKSFLAIDEATTRRAMPPWDPLWPRAGRERSRRHRQRRTASWSLRTRQSNQPDPLHKTGRLMRDRQRTRQSARSRVRSRPVTAPLSKQV